MRKLKKTVWRWCAKYIKTRDSLEDYPESHDLDLVRCRTCGKWLKTKSREAQAGHFLSRGIGGSSGIYFDERGLAIQCYQCNCFKQGSPEEFEKYLLKKYGQEIIDELKIKDKTHTYSLMELEGLLLYYKQEYKKLVENM
jgi:hypothetical protein